MHTEKSMAAGKEWPKNHKLNNPRVGTGLADVHILTSQGGEHPIFQWKLEAS